MKYKIILNVSIDLNDLHDVYYEIYEKSPNEDQLVEIVSNLPELIIGDIFKWGLSDTVVRDNIFDHLKKLKNNEKVKSTSTV